MYGHGGEVGVAQVVGAVLVGAAEGFGDERNLLRRTIRQEGELVAGEDVENLNQHDSAGRGRRRGNDLIAAIAAGERCAVLHFVSREVGGGEQSAALLDGGGKLGRHRTFVEARGIGGDALQGAGELRLREAVAGPQIIAIALEDAARFGEAGEVLCGSKVARFFFGQNVALASEADRRGHYSGEGETAIGLLRVDEPSHGAGNTNGLIARGRKARHDVTLRVEIHPGAGRGGCPLAVVQEVGLARLHADQHEAAAAEVASLRIDHGQRKAHGNRSVHRVSAGLEDFDARVRGVVVDADHHGMLGQHRRRAGEGVGVGRGGLCAPLDAALGRKERRCKNQGDAAGGDADTRTH